VKLSKHKQYIYDLLESGKRSADFDRILMPASNSWKRISYMESNLNKNGKIIITPSCRFMNK